MTQASPDPTDVMGRRVAAFLISLVVLAASTVIGFAVADLKREDISDISPAVQRRLEAQDLTVCDLIRQDNDISVCFENNDTVFYSTEARAQLALFGLPAAVSFLDSVVLASIAGGSIGKLIVGLRVVKASTGQRAGFPAHLLRWLFWVVDGFFYCFPLVGLITGFTVKGHRRVGDLVAGTVVVPRAAVGHPPAYPGNAAALHAVPAPWAPPATETTWAPPATETTWAPPATETTWAPPATETTWAPPTPIAGTEAGADAIEAAKAAPGAPQWDPVRRAYVLWEPSRGQLLRYDDAAQEWRPLT